MSALRLTANARRLGATFVYDGDGRVLIGRLERLPPNLQDEVLLRRGDIESVVREHSVPVDFTGSDVADAARKIALSARKVGAQRA